MPTFAVWTFRRGLVIRLQHLADRAEAFRVLRDRAMAERSLFLYDLGSPYAYLAAERIGGLLPDAEWQPILLGGLFKLNGRSSWGLGPEREARRAEIEQRAARYGLPPIRWRPGPPQTWLVAMRAATLAKQQGREVDFSLAAFRAAFVGGRDLGEPAEVAALAPFAGLDPAELLAAVARRDIKDELRAATELAHERGVCGVPTIVVGGKLFWGDDRVAEAAAAAVSSR